MTATQTTAVRSVASACSGEQNGQRFYTPAAGAGPTHLILAAGLTEQLHT